jgi:hypothetical protein
MYKKPIPQVIGSAGRVARLEAEAQIYHYPNNHHNGYYWFPGFYLAYYHPIMETFYYQYKCNNSDIRGNVAVGLHRAIEFGKVKGKGYTEIKSLKRFPIIGWWTDEKSEKFVKGMLSDIKNEEIINVD